MGFDWLEFLRLAKELAECDDEAAARSAISRAYYAAFLWARDYVVHELAVRIPKYEAHDTVWGTLSEQGRKRAENSAGAGGKRARAWRNQADYDSKLSGQQSPKQHAALAIKTAEAIIANLSTTR